MYQTLECFAHCLLDYVNFVPQLLQNFAPFVGVPQLGQNFAPAKDAP